MGAPFTAIVANTKFEKPSLQACIKDEHVKVDLERNEDGTVIVNVRPTPGMQLVVHSERRPGVQMLLT